MINEHLKCISISFSKIVIKLYNLMNIVYCLQSNKKI